jgi:hypothetical protein
MQDLESDWGNSSWEALQNVLTSKKFLKRARGADGQTEDGDFLVAASQILSDMGIDLLPGSEEYVTTSALGSRVDLLGPALTNASKDYLALRLQESANQAYSDGISILPLDSLGQRSFGWEAFKELHAKSFLSSKAGEYADEYLMDFIAGTPNECPFSSDGKLDTLFSHSWKRLATRQGTGLRFRMLQDWYGIVSNSEFKWNDRTAKWFERHKYSQYCSSENSAD